MKLTIMSSDETGLSTLSFDFTCVFRDLSLDKFENQYYINLDAGNQHIFKMSLSKIELNYLRMVLGE